MFSAKPGYSTVGSASALGAEGRGFKSLYPDMEKDYKKPFHKHIMIRAKVLNPPQDIKVVKNWLKNFVEDIDMKLLQGPYVSYVDVPGNKGLTAVVMIETSHIAFHVWDEEDPALLQFDLYTCGALDVEKVLSITDSFFHFQTAEYLVYDRENGFELIESKK